MRNRDSHDRPTADQITAFEKYLCIEEREQTTIEKYLRNIRAFAVWLGNVSVTKSAVIAWKEHLLTKQYAPATVNAALASLNAFFKFAGWEECRVKALRLQRRVFRDPDRELIRDEYDRLISTAYGIGKTRLGLLMETVCATSIRVSEVQYITVEAAQRGKAEISLKGKIRTIMLPGKLCRKLLKYAKKRKCSITNVHNKGHRRSGAGVLCYGRWLLSTYVLSQFLTPLPRRVVIKHLQKSKKSFPVKSFSPETERDCPDGRSGRR